MRFRPFVFIFMFGPIDLRGCLTISRDVKTEKKPVPGGGVGSTGSGRDKGVGCEIMSFVGDICQIISNQ